MTWWKKSLNITKGIIKISISKKKGSIRHLILLIRIMRGSYLPPVVCRMAHVLFICYLCLFANSGVQRIMRCVFVLFFFALLLFVSLDCSFRLPLRYSLKFISIQKTLTFCKHESFAYAPSS